MRGAECTACAGQARGRLRDETGTLGLDFSCGIAAMKRSAVACEGVLRSAGSTRALESGFRRTCPLERGLVAEVVAPHNYDCSL